MKKFGLIIFCLLLPLMIVACGDMNTKKDIELMGAGDRIHDTFTFANVGVNLEETDENVFKISGSIERLESSAIKEEFEIDSDINNVVVIKLSANGKDVDKDKVNIKIDGVRSYDAEHLNGSDYTFVILEAVKSQTVSIKVSWNGVDENTYVIVFDENLILK